MRNWVILLALLVSMAGRAADDLSALTQGQTSHVPRLPGPDDRNIAQVVATLLERSHYSQHPLDAAYSSKFLDRYLDAWDPAHIMFLQSDLKDFEKYRTNLCTLTRRQGDTFPGEVIFARYLERCEEQLTCVTNLLANEKFTFDADDRFQFNRKEAPRPTDLTEAKKLWRDRLRFEYLQEKLNKKKPDDIVKTILRRYARQIRYFREMDTDDVLQIYLTMLAEVYDPHSQYMGKPTYENFNIQMKLSLFGIGAMLGSEDGYCKIISLTPGSPAEKSKRIKANDKIVAVAQGTNEFVDVVDMKLQKVVELIRGAKGTDVRLSIIPADAVDSSTRKTVALVRDEIKIEDSEAKAKLLEFPTENNQPKRRIGVIDLPSFYADLQNRAVGHKSTTTDVIKLLNKLTEEKVEGIVLDLRRNGGGSLEEAIRLTGIFIKEGPVVQVRDYDGTINVEKDKDPEMVYNGPLVVLVSRGSASASEILAAALQDYGRALVVGDISTHGKGTVQTVLELNQLLRVTNQLGALKFTIRKFYRVNGSSTQLKGVTPDIILPSVHNYMEGGEGSIPGALPWDTIPSAKYDAVNIIPPMLDELRKRSDARVAKDKDFAWIQTEIERYKKTKDDKTISLNEKQRLREKDEAEQRSKARKKELKARGEPAYKTYDLTLKNVGQPGLPPATVKTNAVASVEGKDGSKKTASETVDPEAEDAEAKEEVVADVDINLDEARRIIFDMIELKNKTQSVAIKP